MKVEHLAERAAVEEVLQLARAVLRIRRRNRILPRLVVVRLPLALEPFFPAGAHPVFRLFEMDALRAGVEGTLDAFNDEVAVGDGRADVVIIFAVPDQAAALFLLDFVHVVLAVEVAVVILCVFAPSDAAHDLRDVAAIFPRFETGGQAGVDVVRHRNVGIKIDARVPRVLRLEGKSLFSLRTAGRLGRSSTGFVCRIRAGCLTSGEADYAGYAGDCGMREDPSRFCSGFHGGKCYPMCIAISAGRSGFDRFVLKPHCYFPSLKKYFPRHSVAV